MKKILAVLLLFFSKNSIGCSINYDTFDYDEFFQRYEYVFTGRVESTRKERNFNSIRERVYVKFTPLKIRKGMVNLASEFRHLSNTPSFEFIKGDLFFIIADVNKNIKFDYCYPGSQALRNSDLDEIDFFQRERRLFSALKSDSRKELTWAKKELKRRLKSFPEKNGLDLMLKEVNKRLASVY